MNNLIWIFLILNLINYICDYPLQGEFLSAWKKTNNYALFVHCFIWAMGISFGLHYFGILNWWKIIMLFIGHFLIDGWKCRGYYKKIKLSDNQSLYIDQALHLVQIIICII